MRRRSLPKGRVVSWIAGWVVAFGLLGCTGGQTDLKQDPDFRDLRGRVTTLEARTEDYNALRGDVLELKSRAGILRSSSPTSYPASAGVSSKSPGYSTMEGMYKNGRDLYTKGDMEGAAKVFREMLARDPRDKLAPNARYWSGECYYGRRLFQEAMAEFDQVLRDYPQSDKAPDALLKIAYCLHLLGDGPAAMGKLRDLLAWYPNSPAAQMVKKGQTVFRN